MTHLTMETYLLAQNSKLRLISIINIIRLKGKIVNEKAAKKTIALLYTSYPGNFNGWMPDGAA